MNKGQPDASIIGKYKLYILFKSFLSRELAVSVPTEPANPAKRANPSFLTPPVSPFGNSCDLSGLSPQRLKSKSAGADRHPVRLSCIGGGGGGRRLDLYCDGKAYTSCPSRSCSAAIFWQFQLLVCSKCTQNIATGRGSLL
jgi:hypothetical protein